jgi:hypothetical protein
MKAGTFVIDSNVNIVAVLNDFQTEDITPTPITSPVAIAAGATKTLLIPENAIELRLNSDSDFYNSEDATFAQYDRTLGGTYDYPPIAKRTNIHLKNPGSAEILVYFKFENL